MDEFTSHVSKELEKHGAKIEKISTSNWAWTYSPNNNEEYSEEGFLGFHEAILGLVEWLIRRDKEE